MTPELISTTYFINPILLCVYMCIPLFLLGNDSVKSLPIVARQRLRENFTAATCSHAVIEELLDASFSIRSVSYEGKFFPELVALLHKCPQVLVKWVSWTYGAI
jgi:hypothetical protein